MSMYCYKCGEFINEEAIYCVGCGIKLNLNKEERIKSFLPEKNNWEYKTFSWDFPNDSKSMRINNFNTEFEIKRKFWELHQNQIIKELQKFHNLDWETIGQIGANCVKTNSEEIVYNGSFTLLDIFLTLSTFGVYLIYYFLVAASSSVLVLTDLSADKFEIELRRKIE